MTHRHHYLVAIPLVGMLLSSCSLMTTNIPIPTHSARTVNEMCDRAKEFLRNDLNAPESLKLESSDPTDLRSEIGERAGCILGAADGYYAIISTNGVRNTPEYIPDERSPGDELREVAGENVLITAGEDPIELRTEIDGWGSLLVLAPTDSHGQYDRDLLTSAQIDDCAEFLVRFTDEFRAK